MIDANLAWAAFEARDRTRDGQFVGAVKTTGIYCKPSCPARRPKRERVTFYSSAEEARADGFRPCLRCRPDEVSRDREAVAQAPGVLEAKRTTEAANPGAERGQRRVDVVGGVALEGAGEFRHPAISPAGDRLVAEGYPLIIVTFEDPATGELLADTTVSHNGDLYLFGAP